MSKVGGCWQSRYFKVSIGCFPVCPTALSRQTGASVGIPPCSAASRVQNPPCLHFLAAVGGAAAGLQVCRSSAAGGNEKQKTTVGTERRSANCSSRERKQLRGTGIETAPQLPLGPGCPPRSEEPLFRAGRIIRAEPAVLAHSPPLQLQEPGSRPPALPQPDCSNSLAPNVNLAMLPGGTASTGPPTKSNRPREPWVNVSPVRILPTSDVGLSVAGFDPARREYAAAVRHWRSASCRSPGRWPARHKIRCIHPVEYIHT